MIIYYWLSGNLYIGSDNDYYRIDWRQVGKRTWVQDEPVRVRVGGIKKRGTVVGEAS